MQMNEHIWSIKMFFEQTIFVCFFLVFVRRFCLRVCNWFDISINHDIITVYSAFCIRKRARVFVHFSLSVFLLSWLGNLLEHARKKYTKRREKSYKKPNKRESNSQPRKKESRMVCTFRMKNVKRFKSFRFRKSFSRNWRCFGGKIIGLFDSTWAMRLWTKPFRCIRCRAVCQPKPSEGEWKKRNERITNSI